MGFNDITASAAGGPATSVVGPTNAPAAGRGVIVQLGKITGVNLNAVAATTIFTVPASGLTRCWVAFGFVRNSSGVDTTTNAFSLGASATPTDWMVAGAVALAAGTSKILGDINTTVAGAVATTLYAPGAAFVINVTVGGAASTADIAMFGFYE